MTSDDMMIRRAQLVGCVGLLLLANACTSETSQSGGEERIGTTAAAEIAGEGGAGDAQAPSITAPNAYPPFVLEPLTAGGPGIQLPPAVDAGTDIPEAGSIDDPDAPWWNGTPVTRQTGRTELKKIDLNPPPSPPPTTPGPCEPDPGVLIPDDAVTQQAGPKEPYVANVVAGDAVLGRFEESLVGHLIGGVDASYYRTHSVMATIDTSKGESMGTRFTHNDSNIGEVIPSELLGLMRRDTYEQMCRAVTNESAHVNYFQRVFSSAGAPGVPAFNINFQGRIDNESNGTLDGAFTAGFYPIESPDYSSYPGFWATGGFVGFLSALDQAYIIPDSSGYHGVSFDQGLFRNAVEHVGLQTERAVHLINGLWSTNPSWVAYDHPSDYPRVPNGSYQANCDWVTWTYDGNPQPPYLNCPGSPGQVTCCTTPPNDNSGLCGFMAQGQCKATPKVDLYYATAFSANQMYTTSSSSFQAAETPWPHIPVVVKAGNPEQEWTPGTGASGEIPPEWREPGLSVPLEGLLALRVPDHYKNSPTAREAVIRGAMYKELGWLGKPYGFASYTDVEMIEKGAYGPHAGQGEADTPNMCSGTIYTAYVEASGSGKNGHFFQSDFWDLTLNDPGAFMLAGSAESFAGWYIGGAASSVSGAAGGFTGAAAGHTCSGVPGDPNQEDRIMCPFGYSEAASSNPYGSTWTFANRDPYYGLATYEADPNYPANYASAMASYGQRDASNNPQCILEAFPSAATLTSQFSFPTGSPFGWITLPQLGNITFDQLRRDKVVSWTMVNALGLAIGAKIFGAPIDVGIPGSVAKGISAVLQGTELGISMTGDIIDYDMIMRAAQSGQHGLIADLGPVIANGEDPTSTLVGPIVSQFLNHMLYDDFSVSESSNGLPPQVDFSSTSPSLFTVGQVGLGRPLVFHGSTTVPIVGGSPQTVPGIGYLTPAGAAEQLLVSTTSPARGLDFETFCSSHPGAVWYPYANLVYTETAVPYALGSGYGPPIARPYSALVSGDPASAVAALLVDMYNFAEAVDGPPDSPTIDGSSGFSPGALPTLSKWNTARSSMGISCPDLSSSGALAKAICTTASGTFDSSPKCQTRVLEKAFAMATKSWGQTLIQTWWDVPYGLFAGSTTPHAGTSVSNSSFYGSSSAPDKRGFAPDDLWPRLPPAAPGQTLPASFEPVYADRPTLLGPWTQAVPTIINGKTIPAIAENSMEGPDGYMTLGLETASYDPSMGHNHRWHFNRYGNMELHDDMLSRELDVEEHGTAWQDPQRVSFLQPRVGGMILLPDEGAAWAPHEGPSLSYSVNVLQAGVFTVQVTGVAPDAAGNMVEVRISGVVPVQNPHVPDEGAPFDETYTLPAPYKIVQSSTTTLTTNYQVGLGTGIQTITLNGLQDGYVHLAVTLTRVDSDGQGCTDTAPPPPPPPPCPCWNPNCIVTSVGTGSPTGGNGSPAGGSGSPTGSDSIAVQGWPVAFDPVTGIGSFTGPCGYEAQAHVAGALIDIDLSGATPMLTASTRLDGSGSVALVVSSNGVTRDVVQPLSGSDANVSAAVPVAPGSTPTIWLELTNTITGAVVSTRPSVIQVPGAALPLVGTMDGGTGGPSQ